MAKQRVKRRAPKRKMQMPKRIKNIPGRLLVTKTFDGGAVTGDASTGKGAGNYSFNLGQVPDLTSLCGLFDQYRINGIQIKLVPTSTNAPVANQGVYQAQNQVATVYTYIDYTDANAPSSLQEMLDRKGVKIHQAIRPWTEYISKPKVLTQEYRSATLTGYGVSRGYQSCDYPTTPHYGWKWWTENSYANQQTRVFIKLYVEFKEPR